MWVYVFDLFIKCNLSAMPYIVIDNGDKSVMKTDKVPAYINSLYPSEHVSCSNLSERELNEANETYVIQCRGRILTQGHIIGCFWLKCQSLTDHLWLHGESRDATYGTSTGGSSELWLQRPSPFQETIVLNSVSVTLLRFLFDRSSRRSITSKGEKLQTKKHIVIQNWKDQPCN